MSFAHPTRRWSLPGRWLLPLLLTALPLLAWPPQVRGEDGPLDGEFVVRSASIVIESGVLDLDALIQYPDNDRIRGELNDGVTLSFEIDIQLARHRRFWFNEGLLDLRLERQLSYHVVSDRYLVREGSGEDDPQESYPTLEAALEALGRIEHQPVLVEKQLRGEGPYDVSVRAGVRRGHLPAALRTLAFWRDDWYRTSPWYSWTLVR
ncbi:MAG TPA: DUF4390 domain-containing protein [Steroidobacteraceae bacterium]|nr:DUF4390 domain-containing protein [Steroidobacteraceae bacterium]